MFKTSNKLLVFSDSSTLCCVCKDTVAKFVCVLTALLWAQLTAQKYGGCQNCSGTAKHQDRPRWLCPSWVPLHPRVWRTSMGVQERGRAPLHLCKKQAQTPSLTWKASPFILQCCESMLQRQQCPHTEAPSLRQVKPSDLTAAGRDVCKGI